MDIPGKLSDKSKPFPMMLPSAAQFSAEMRRLDVRITDTIVCYDTSGMISAPRAFWMFKVFGAKNAHVLDGPM